MLYKFKSKATSDVIMLEPNGRQILAIVGKDDGAKPAKGILLPSEMPAAMQALEAAIVQDETARREAAAQGEVAPRSDAVSLRQRATPFIAMLQRAHAANKEIVWGT